MKIIPPSVAASKPTDQEDWEDLSGDGCTPVDDQGAALKELADLCLSVGVVQGPIPQRFYDDIERARLLDQYEQELKAAALGGYPAHWTAALPYVRAARRGVDPAVAVGFAHMVLLQVEQARAARGIVQ